MPSTPSKSSQTAAADETGFFCLSTVAAYGVILDFESSAVVIEGTRRFLEPREVEVLGALLFAEGGAVAANDIFRICRFSAPNTANDMVSRFVRRLRSLVAPLGTILPAPEGYRFVHHQNGRGNAAREIAERPTGSV